MRLLELDSYNMENDRTFLKSIEEHVKDPYIRERLINRLEWYMVMANRCQCFYYMSACMGIVMPTLILLLNSIPGNMLSDGMRQLCITALSGLSGIVGGLSGIFGWQSETSFYMLGVGNYRDRKKRDQMFLNALEDLSLKENQMWQKEESSHSSYRQEQGGRRRPNG
ncbi:DUF4231 domain-containing protein [Enterocloster bolteae]|uniref:DUF4231 domain-containing protein n=1 Tax=Enterocloster bolteae TaxID=208479 RepID=UPI002904783B|nr:DUF4231 domain-containing protein [Enterocloster bolteae]MDU1141109.1 DUF4231 domain-containing protein [Enterocloster bolteae]